MRQPVKMESMRIRNKMVAEEIGLSESGVWYIRHGRRFPRFETMEAIAAAYKWPVADQVEVRDNYAEAFNARLVEHYARVGIHG